MVGGGDDLAYWDALRLLAVELGVSNHITWHGYRCDAAAMILGSDVTILASHSEGVPRVIQEAMVLAVPTVMPVSLGTELSYGGIPIRYGPNEPGALTEAIAAAMELSMDRLLPAAEWVARTWSWARVLGDWADVLRPITNLGTDAP
jgi:glycosyltransferase involved in cell wall biosynthesis